MEDIKEVALVVSADDMDDEAFALHMTHRHPDNLGGLACIRFSTDGRAETRLLVSAWRAFHRRLHQLDPRLPHEHQQSARKHAKSA